jgi:hypothetical protein
MEIICHNMHCQWVRWWAYIAAVILRSVNVARGLVAKELAKSVYVVLHEQVDFNHQFKGTPLTRQEQARWPRRASPPPN